MCPLVLRRRLLVALSLLALLAAPAVVVAQTSQVLDSGVVQFEFFNDGELGADLGVGTGFVFNGDNGLFEGTFLVGQSSSQVSGEAYEANNEWVALAPVTATAPPAGFDEAYETRYNDSAALGGGPIGVEADARAYTDTGAPFVVVDYDVTNTTGSTLTGIYIGIFADWDVGGAADPADDLAGYDAGTRLLYAYDSDSNPSTNYFGVAALGNASVSGISYDALPGDAILYGALTTIQSPPPGTAADRRTVVGTGPYTLGAGQSVNVKFAFVGGSSLSDIIANAAAAQASVGGCDLKFLAADLVYNAGTRQLCARVTARNNGTAPRTARLELDYDRNGGNPQGTRVLGSGTLPAGAQATREVCLRVPGNAPAGNYNFDLRLVDVATGTDCSSYTETIAISAPRLPGGDLGAELFEVEAAADFSAVASAVDGAGAAVTPNPFARRTTIRYAVEAPADVRLAVYDVLGREVAVLVDGRAEAGQHSAVFNASDLAAGTYVYRLVVGSEVRTGRLTLVR